MSIQFDRTTRLLFIGDSITDCGRREDKDELGSGYVRRLRDFLIATQPERTPIIINRGISGNKIPDLQKRWDRDVIELKPDILSIFIGINDVWHALVPDRAGCPIDHYIAGYRDILSRTRSAFPACELVLCEPSVLWLPEPKNADDLLLPYVDAVHALAKEYQVKYVVPLHSTFNHARAKREDFSLTTDGVHPTSAGHMLIAMTWLKTTGVLKNV
jgi:lysophospholipase L1-like esterase